jgi:hypothetical protein
MTRQGGIWIDRREALVVSIRGGEEYTQGMHSGMERASAIPVISGREEGAADNQGGGNSPASIGTTMS